MHRLSSRSLPWDVLNGDIPEVSPKHFDIRTGHKRVQLVGNSDNVCSGKLQIEDTKTRTWSPVTSVKTISPDLACNHMFCGTSAYNSSESDGMQLNCTGKATRPSSRAQSLMKVVLLCLVVLLAHGSLMPTLFFCCRQRCRDSERDVLRLGFYLRQ